MLGRRPKAVAIIPARLGSTRLPRKALLDETGTPLVVHVCQRVAGSEKIDRVVVATDADEIAAAVRSGGFEAIMTSPEHPNGTSRLVEAARLLKLRWSDLVVNVQGDEPEIEAGVIEGAMLASGVEPMHAWYPEAGPRHAAVGTVATLIGREQAENPNVVKVTTGLLDPETGVGPAMYFSRASIPHDRDGAGEVRCLRHVGIYAYQTRELQTFATLEESPLERGERLEQLRWLEHGYPIAVAVRESSHAGIDTPEQYAAFVARWRASRHA
ncbi:MAG: 3-deoxy-manno-octulosonate cytidylyltransferase [Phycisphaerales bacterium]